MSGLRGRVVASLGRWFWVAVVAGTVCFVVSAPGLSAADEPTKTPSKDAAKETVKLIVDYGDNLQKHFVAIPWKKDLTILDAMDVAAKHPRGIRFETRGKGETMFLLKIDDLKNEGRHLNWIYYVNGKPGETSFAIHSLQAGDIVLWKFGEYRYNP